MRERKSELIRVSSDTKKSLQEIKVDMKFPDFDAVIREILGKPSKSSRF
jgi:hypothetical protein